MPCSNCGSISHNRCRCTNHRIDFQSFKCGCSRCWSTMDNTQREQWKKESSKRYSKNYINNIWNQRNHHNYDITSSEWTEVTRGPTNNNIIIRQDDGRRRGGRPRTASSHLNGPTNNRRRYPRASLINNSQTFTYSVTIQNKLSHDCFVYWMIPREDTKDYSECKRFMNITSQSKGKAKIYNSDTVLIFVKNNMELNNNIYYTDLKNFIIKELLITSIPNNSTIILKDDLEKWKESTLKLNFLIEQLKRLGIDTNDTYASIIDMHEDITIPYHTEIDKETAGIPSTLTNIT